MTTRTAKPSPETDRPVGQAESDKRAEDGRKLRAAMESALAVPQNQRVLAALAKR